MLTHFTGRFERMIFAAAGLALVLLVIAGAARLSAQEADEVELRFAAPAIAASHTTLVIFVDGVACADLMSESLGMPIILGAGCVEDGDTIEFMVYGEPDDGSERSAVRLGQTFVAELGTQLVLDNWSTDAPDAPLPAHMSAYIDALDGSPPAETTPEIVTTKDGTPEDAAEDEEEQEYPALPVVGNLGFTPAGTSSWLLLFAVIAMLALVAGGRQSTRSARPR